MDAATQTLLAKVALTEALKHPLVTQGQVVIPEHEVGLAAFYVDEAEGHLLEHVSGRDPGVHAPTLGRRVIVEYAKHRLIGIDPLNAAAFDSALSEWLRAAAVSEQDERRASGASESYPGVESESTRRHRPSRTSRWRR